MASILCFSILVTHFSDHWTNITYLPLKRSFRLSISHWSWDISWEDSSLSLENLAPNSVLAASLFCFAELNSFWRVRKSVLWALFRSFSSLSCLSNRVTWLCNSSFSVSNCRRQAEVLFWHWVISYSRRVIDWCWLEIWSCASLNCSCRT